MRTKINICFCIDDNYVCQLLAVLNSLKNSNAHNELKIFVISSGLEKENRKRIQDTISDVPNFAIEFVLSEDRDVASLEAGGHISSATYIRFEIPWLLKEESKVLYLDADLVVMDDLKDFWDLDIENVYVGAVTNPFFVRWKQVVIEEEHGYFNAGVLLMNLNKWRDDEVKSKALHFLHEFKKQAIMFDQDALNHVFKGQWVKAPLRWNLQTSYLMRLKKFDLEKRTEIFEAIKRPGIIHYSSSSKPWDFMDPHPMRSSFLQFASVNEIIKRPKSKVSLLRSIVKFLYWKIKYFIILIR